MKHNGRGSSIVFESPPLSNANLRGDDLETPKAYTNTNQLTLTQSYEGSLTSRKSQIPSPASPSVQPAWIETVRREEVERSLRIYDSQVSIEESFPPSCHFTGGRDCLLREIGIPFFGHEPLAPDESGEGHEGDHVDASQALIYSKSDGDSKL